MKLEIPWTDDCQGKKDYDGSVLTFTSRYWPGHLNVFDTSCPEMGMQTTQASKPSAVCTLVLHDGDPKGGYGSDTSEDLISQSFEGDTFEDVSKQLEVWAQTQMDRVCKALHAEFSTHA